MNKTVVIACLVLAAVSTSQAEDCTAQFIKVQGFLSDKSGGGPAVPADGTLSMTFGLYDADVAGALVSGTGPLSVEVDEGLYDAEVPFCTADFDGSERWIEIAVEGEVLYPRIVLGSVPFAYTADTLDGYEGVDLDQAPAIALLQSELTTATGDLAQHLDDPTPHPTCLSLAGGTMEGPLVLDAASGHPLQVNTRSDSSLYISGDHPFCELDIPAGSQSSTAGLVFSDGGAEAATMVYDRQSGNLEIRNSGGSLPDLTVHAGGRVSVGSAGLRVDGVLTAPRPAGHFDCNSDWDGHDDGVDAGDIVACIEAAKLHVGNDQDGSDRAAVVHLPDGEFDLCAATACPIDLYGGMRIVGVGPRLSWTPGPGGIGQAPDLEFVANGGTWIDGGGTGNTIFYGERVRGLVIENVGFKNFDIALRFGNSSEIDGGEDTDGIAFSRLENLFFIGGPAGGSSTAAVRMTNFQHVRIETLKAFNVRQIVHGINDNPDWEGGNSIWIDVYGYVYRGTQGGILLEAKQHALNYVVLERPQVNMFGAPVPGSQQGEGVAMLFRGDSESGDYVQGIAAIEADVEAGGLWPAEDGIRCWPYCYNVNIEVASSSGDIAFQGGTVDFGDNGVDFSSRNNRATCSSGTCVFQFGSGSNVLEGQWRNGLQISNMQGGFYYDSDEGRFVASIHDLVMVGRSSESTARIYMGDRGELRLSSGSGIENVSTILTTGAGTSGTGPVVWAAEGKSCGTVCGSAKHDCVQSWTLGDDDSGNCSGVSGTRVCFCATRRDLGHD